MPTVQLPQFEKSCENAAVFYPQLESSLTALFVAHEQLHHTNEHTLQLYIQTNAKPPNTLANHYNGKPRGITLPTPIHTTSQMSVLLVVRDTHYKRLQLQLSEYTGLIKFKKLEIWSFSWLKKHLNVKELYQRDQIIIDRQLDHKMNLMLKGTKFNGKLLKSPKRIELVNESNKSFVPIEIILSQAKFWCESTIYRLLKRHGLNEHGDSMSIEIGNGSMKRKQIVANINVVLHHLITVEKIDHGLGIKNAWIRTSSGNSWNFIKNGVVLNAHDSPAGS
ncbi:hypothetical protein DAMA08_017340 [Martiniozyma asiatica (nom. inval.)]|nr:hypothetical protein DAMA08_017340 [Martiniozyma asiatica]